jgi:hypothetical protein
MRRRWSAVRSSFLRRSLRAQKCELVAMSKNAMIEKPDPWRVPLAVAQIPDTGLHRELEADPATRLAVADIGGLREVLSVQASFDVTPQRGGRFHVVGQLRARIGQTCVVTLEEIESEIDEPIDLMFAPPDQIPQMAALIDEQENDPESEEDTPDPPEPIENGIIDLGRVATDALYLAVEPLVEAPDPEDHPVAALKALQAAPEKAGGKKPKRK